MDGALLIKPAEGRRVLDPATRQALPADGLRVALDSPHATYWHRRLADGDVVATTDTSKPEPIKNRSAK